MYLEKQADNSKQDRQRLTMEALHDNDGCCRIMMADKDEVVILAKDTKGRRGLVYYFVGGLLIFGGVIGGKLIWNDLNANKRRLLMQGLVDLDAARKQKTDFACEVPLPLDDDIRVDVEDDSEENEQEEEDDGERQALLPQANVEEQNRCVNKVCESLATMLVCILAVVALFAIHHEINHKIANKWKETCVATYCENGGFTEALRFMRLAPRDSAYFVKLLNDAKRENNQQRIADIEFQVKEGCSMHCQDKAWDMKWSPQSQHTKYFDESNEVEK